jgi:hypothetical protein
MPSRKRKLVRVVVAEQLDLAGVLAGEQPKRFSQLSVAGPRN